LPLPPSTSSSSSSIRPLSDSSSGSSGDSRQPPLPAGLAADVSKGLRAFLSLYLDATTRCAQASLQAIDSKFLAQAPGAGAADRQTDRAGDRQTDRQGAGAGAGAGAEAEALLRGRPIFEDLLWSLGEREWEAAGRARLERGVSDRLVSDLQGRLDSEGQQVLLQELARLEYFQAFREKKKGEVQRSSELLAKLQ
jgi:hypothetical protein